jgi:hypothetical protein
LIFGAVSIARFAFLADGERINQRHTRVALDGFEQRREKRAQLFASGVAVEIARLAEINGKFVQQDDARFTAEQFGERFRAGRGVAFVALADALVTNFASERASKFAPRGMARMPSSMLRPLAGSAFSPSKAAMRIFVVGTNFGSTNSATLATPFMPLAA